MRHATKSGLIVFSVFLCFCLAFVATESVQGGGAKKPSVEKWTVTLPGPEANFSMYGDGANYQSEAYVYVQHLVSDAGNHSFYLTVKKNPNGRFIGIQGVHPELVPGGLDETLRYCFFPLGCSGLGSPACIECFLNQAHPQEYIHIGTAFQTGIVDLNAMVVGEGVEVTHFNCDLWNTNTGFPDEYHSLITDWTNPAGTAAMTFVKVGVDTWELRISGADFEAHESWLEALNSGRKGIKTARYTNYVEAPGAISALMTWKRTIAQ